MLGLAFLSSCLLLYVIEKRTTLVQEEKRCRKVVEAAPNGDGGHFWIWTQWPVTRPSPSGKHRRREEQQQQHSTAYSATTARGSRRTATIFMHATLLAGTIAHCDAPLEPARSPAPSLPQEGQKVWLGVSSPRSPAWSLMRANNQWRHQGRRLSGTRWTAIIPVR